MIDLGPIKERLAAATPGPWAIDTAKNCEHDHESPDLVTRHDGDPSLRNPLYARNVVRCYPGDADDDKYSGQETKDAIFISYARTDVEQLVAEVERYRTVMYRCATELPGDAVVILAHISLEELGERPLPEPEEPTTVVSLMEALEASLAAVKNRELPTP